MIKKEMMKKKLNATREDGRSSHISSVNKLIDEISDLEAELEV